MPRQESLITRPQLKAMRRRIGANIKTARLDKRMNIESLAHQAFMSISVLDLCERGKIDARMDQIVLIAHVLGTSPDDLLSN